MNDPKIPDDMQNNNNCGPTCAPMIAEYYKMHRGYSGFDDLLDAHNRLYGLMKCNNWGGLGVAPWNAPYVSWHYCTIKGYFIYNTSK